VVVEQAQIKSADAAAHGDLSRRLDWTGVTLNLAWQPLLVLVLHIAAIGEPMYSPKIEKRHRKKLWQLTMQGRSMP
jgi:hypothetical protein